MTQQHKQFAAANDEADELAESGASLDRAERLSIVEDLVDMEEIIEEMKQRRKCVLI